MMATPIIQAYQWVKAVTRIITIATSVRTTLTALERRVSATRASSVTTATVLDVSTTVNSSVCGRPSVVATDKADKPRLGYGQS